MAYRFKDEANELIKEIRATAFSDRKLWRYTHNIAISGFVISTPDFYRSATGKAFAKLGIWQVDKYITQFFPCQSYSKKVLAQLKELKNVSIIEGIGRIAVSQGKLLIHLEEIEVSNELCDKPLLPSYGGATIEWTEDDLSTALS